MMTAFYYYVFAGRETRMWKLAAGMGARGVRAIGFRRSEKSRPVLQRRCRVGRHVRPGTAKRAFLSHWYGFVLRVYWIAAPLLVCDYFLLWIIIFSFFPELFIRGSRIHGNESKHYFVSRHGSESDDGTSGLHRQWDANAKRCFR